MSQNPIRAATAADGPRLLDLWASLFDDDDDDDDATATASWRDNALEWFNGCLHQPDSARFPVIDVGGEVVATAVGTLELGVPNPHCPRGRTVRLANLVTAPEHRGRGYATALVSDVIDWARLNGGDRVDLSATPDGQRIYEKIGFVMTSTSRLKLVL